jgi:hypothetical protein
MKKHFTYLLIGGGKMSEEFITEEENEEYIFKIYLQKEFDRHICSIYVILKIDGNILFTERTTITHEAKMIGKNIIKKQFPKVENPDKILIKLIIDNTFKNAKGRINSEDFKAGETYEKVFSLENIRNLFG